MDFKDFFRILISNRDSLSYPEKHMNIIFKFFVFGIIFLIISDTYNEDICNKCGFGEYLNKMDKLISVVYIIYVLLFIFIIVMMKLNYGR